MRIHWILIALFLIITLRSMISGGAEEMAFAAAGLGLIFACIFLHEVGHVLAGIRAGGYADRIVLWPLGGLAYVRGVPPIPRLKIKVSASGPLITLTLATLFLGILVLMKVDLLGRAPLAFGERLLLWLFWANAAMTVLNLLPAFPLDGGDVFRWALEGWFPERGGSWATLLSVKVSKVVAVLCGGAGLVLFLSKTGVHGFFSNEDAIWLLFIAMTIFVFSEKERRDLEFAAASAEEEDEDEFSVRQAPEPVRRPGMLERWRDRRRMRRRESEVRREVEIRKRVDALLDKIAREGFNALSEREKAFLKEASKRYQKDPTA